MNLALLHLKELEIEHIYQFGTVFSNTCYEDSYMRISNAALLLGNLVLPPFQPKKRFCRMWGNLIQKDGLWKKFPEEYRGMGAPGALAMKGWAKIIRKPEIWNGKLLPGAVLQGWEESSYYKMVRKGVKPPRDKGHSFVFISYQYTEGSITGMRVADNGHHYNSSNGIVHRHQWRFLVGANTIQ